MGVARRRTWLVVLLALLAALVVVAPPASAHSDLSSSDPEDGAVLAEAPATLSFTFTEELLPQGNAVTLTETATGTRLALGEVEVKGDTVRVAWPEESPAGQYRAAYRVVSADGHPIDGAITFAVEGARGATETETEAAGASPSPTVSPSPAVVSATPQPVSTDADPAATPGAGLLLWALGLGAVALAGAGLAARSLRRTR